MVEQSLIARRASRWGTLMRSVLAYLGWSFFVCGTAMLGFLAYVTELHRDAVMHVDEKVTASVESLPRGRVLTVDFSIFYKSANNCVQNTSYTLARPNPADPKHLEYWPIKVDPNGHRPLGIPAEDDTFFSLKFTLDPTLPAGKWFFTGRTSFLCEWLPGLTTPSNHDIPEPGQQPIGLMIPEAPEPPWAHPNAGAHP